MRTILACALGLFLAQTAAMEVKGLTLGQHTSLAALSAQFGHADCPDPAKFAQLGTVLPGLHLECHVPMTYLGFAGTATVYVDRGFVITGLAFPIPAGQEDAVSATLEKKYGAPTSREGDPMDLVGFDAKGAQQKTTGKNPCTNWKRVQDAAVMVCPGQVTYTYVGNNTVNANDL
jgi:hypothetical protein